MLLHLWWVAGAWNMNLHVLQLTTNSTLNSQKKNIVAKHGRWSLNLCVCVCEDVHQLSTCNKELPVGFVQPQKQLVLKVLWANACSSWPEDQPCNTKQSLTSCWGREFRIKRCDSWHTAGKDFYCISGAPKVCVQLLGRFKRAGPLQGGKEVLFLRCLGALTNVIVSLSRWLLI